jgi:hypothetical protein
VSLSGVSGPSRHEWDESWGNPNDIISAALDALSPRPRESRWRRPTLRPICRVSSRDNPGNNQCGPDATGGFRWTARATFSRLGPDVSRLLGNEKGAESGESSAKTAFRVLDKRLYVVSRVMTGRTSRYAQPWGVRKPRKPEAEERPAYNDGPQVYVRWIGAAPSTGGGSPFHPETHGAGMRGEGTGRPPHRGTGRRLSDGATTRRGHGRQTRPLAVWPSRGSSPRFLFSTPLPLISIDSTPGGPWGRCRELQVKANSTSP